jgi:hypothetical protein
LGKQLQGSKAIVLQEKRLSRLTPEEEKTDLIKGYVEKYAAICGKVVTPLMYSIYVEALEDLDTRRIEKGLKEYLRDGTGWPWPGTLRQYIEEEV